GNANRTSTNTTKTIENTGLHRRVENTGKAGKEHHRAAKDRRKNLKTPHRKPTPGRVGTT
ncbi:hypothetical protein ACEWFU_07835, partial [Bifidobacterium hominis]|uniref:hypothetical protein n=1 Tax=Bifidobacterium hominis TaxID=3133177 RepID=UPI003D0223A1